jgi:hypothetical protein
MGEPYRFQCPECGRSYKANKDLGGRLKRCGKCRGTFTIRRHAPSRRGAPAAPPEPVILHDPELPIDQVFNALHDWQGSVRSLPGSFAREITFGSFDPAYRLTLEVTTEADGRRARQVAHRETVALPPEFGAAERDGARKVVDLHFEHTSELAAKLADKPAVVREAAEQLAKELRPPPGGRFAARRLVVEHLQAWQAHWVFRRSEGVSWFFGRPLRVVLPDPPRRSAAPAALATLLGIAAAGAVAWVLWEYDLVRPGGTAPPPPAPVAASVPKPAPLRFAKDGVLQLDDGSFLRGALERREEQVVVEAAGRSQSVAPWQIESLHVDAPVFLRGEGRRLDDLEGRVKSARGAARETLVGLFLEVHRQRDRWARLEGLCAASELPGEPGKRLEAARAEVERLLEAGAPPAVAAAPAVAPDPSAKPPEPTAAATAAAALLRGLAAPMDADARARVVAGLQALRGEKLAQADLVGFALLLLSRSEPEAGLVADRLRLRTAQVDSTFEGAFEKQGEHFVRLRTASGQEVVAYREKEAWTAQLPGGIRLEGAQCAATPGARTASGERLRAALDAFPPDRWMTAPAADHLRAAKAGDGSHPLLRSLAAGHSATALRAGTPAEILEARGALHRLGYAQSAEGRWERTEDRRAAQMGRLVREGKPEEARALLPAPRGPQDFAGAYRSAAVQLQSPLRTVEELNRAVAALDQSIGLASTPGESRHLLALKGSAAGFGTCGSCGGSPARVCTTCRGKGTRTEACAACNGLGYKVTVGVGATGHKTCESCQGKPIRGTRPCERCEGKGTRSCAKCQGVTRLPAAADLARTRPCARCEGTGGQGEGVVHACPSCAGLGLQLVPAAAPDATLP